MTPTLNWKEIALLSETIQNTLESDTQNLFVDRVIVPERPRFLDGFIKGEWVIRLTSRRSELGFLFSVRARSPYFALYEGKGPKAAEKATRSPFDLALAKHIKGARLLRVAPLPSERVLVLWFSSEGKDPSQEKLALALSLIPALPEALLLRVPQDALPGPWSVLARTRNLPDETRWMPPDGAKSPQDFPIRYDSLKSAPVFLRELESALDREAFEARLKKAEKNLRESLKNAKDRQRQSQVAWEEANREPDWQRFGDLLKASLGNPPPVIEAHRNVMDFEKNESVRIPSDPKLSAQAQVEKFYHQAKRKIRRLEEAHLRLETFTETCRKFEKLLLHPPQSNTPNLDWSLLEKCERISGSRVPIRPGTSEPRKKSGGGWLGKTFTSRDGSSIWVGRTRDENLELTFKHARGNDLWMHLRGRPGAHVVIPLFSGKSASLETLLDAANLCIYYSNGETWGKTEVDYTFKKYVKRIKDSTEASYSQNKTLIIEPDAARIKRLFEAAQSD